MVRLNPSSELMPDCFHSNNVHTKLFNRRSAKTRVLMFTVFIYGSGRSLQCQRIAAGAVLTSFFESKVKTLKKKKNKFSGRNDNPMLSNWFSDPNKSLPFTHVNIHPGKWKTAALTFTSPSVPKPISAPNLDSSSPFFKEFFARLTPFHLDTFSFPRHRKAHSMSNLGALIWRQIGPPALTFYFEGLRFTSIHFFFFSILPRRSGLCMGRHACQRAI